jgi:hypothetical protein
MSAAASAAAEIPRVRFARMTLDLFTFILPSQGCNRLHFRTVDTVSATRLKPVSFTVVNPMFINGEVQPALPRGACVYRATVGRPVPIRSAGAEKA